MPESINNATSTARWIWQVLGIAMGAATAVSIVKNGLSIDLVGIPAKLYQNYAWLRDAVFAPIAAALSFIAIPFPAWAKDLVTAYALVGTAHGRAFALASKSLQYFGSPRLRNLTKKTAVIPEWPQVLVGAMFWPWFHFTVSRPLQPVLDRPSKYRKAQKRYLEELQGSYAFVIHTFRRKVLWHLLIITLCSTAFFLWNHLSNVYGPPG